MAKTVSEHEMIHTMIDYFSDGCENIEKVKCLFFAWYEFFNPEKDEEKTATVINLIRNGSGMGGNAELLCELLSVTE